MIDTARTAEIFKLLSGLSDEDMACWQSLCQQAAGKLEKRLRPAVDIQGNMERLCLAAGAMAWRDYSLLAGQEQEGIRDMRIGDISVSLQSGATSLSSSRLLMEHFLAQVADLLEPDGFAFRIV